MKRIHPTDEIAHLWMHKAQPEASNSAHNFYFEGDTIYSYGSHFPIAKHVSNKRGHAVLLTTRSYSHTTAGHVSTVRCAIPASVPVFRVLNINASPGLIIADYKARIAEAMRLAESARSARASHLADAVKLTDEANAYASFAGLKTRFKCSIDREQLRIALQARRVALEENRMMRNAARQAQWAERSRVEALELPEKIEAWRTGSPCYCQFPQTLLRIAGDSVETSMGAKVPVSHAKRLLKIVRQVVASGTEFVTNGRTIHIGHYSVERIEANGTLHAGCHVISYDEIERLAPVLEALPIPETEDTIVVDR